MNDEIREILQELENMYEISELEEQVNNINKIRDYITNLQQENYELKSKLECYENGAYYSSKVDELEQENERLKELCDEYEEEHSNEFKIWKEERHELLDYKSRCKKAIDFVKSMEYCGQEDYFYDKKSKDPCGNDNTFEDSKNKLLNILQNGSEEK